MGKLLWHHVFVASFVLQVVAYKLCKPLGEQPADILPIYCFRAHSKAINLAGCFLLWGSTGVISDPAVLQPFCTFFDSCWAEKSLAVRHGG